MKYKVYLEIPISATAEVVVEANDKKEAGLIAVRMASNDELDFTNQTEPDLEDAMAVLCEEEPV